MHLFFGLWFILSFIVVWALIFFISRNEWKKKGYETKTLYEQTGSIIISAVMALAVSLSVNAVVQFVKYLPDGSDLTGNSVDKNSTDNKNVFKNVSPGSNTFNEFSTFFTTPVTIMLGFLAILFIVKIDIERLQNERRHNRKKAEDNLSDTAHYAIELLMDFDALHIDFFATKEELDKKYGIAIDIEKLSREPDFENLLILNGNECYVSQELIKKLYFISANRQLRHKKLFVDSNLITLEGDVLTESLRKIYYSSVATIFAEHVKRKTTVNYSDIGDDVAKIQSLLEEVFLKTDFDIKNPNNKTIVKIFLKIEHGVRDFYDVQSGSFIQKKTSAQENKNNHLRNHRAQNNLDLKNKESSGVKSQSEKASEPNGKEMDGIKISIKEPTQIDKSSFLQKVGKVRAIENYNDVFKVFDKSLLVAKIEKISVINEFGDPFKASNKSFLRVKNDFKTIEKALAILYSNSEGLLRKGNLLHKIMEVYSYAKNEGKELYRPDEYILSRGLQKCELDDFIDFYKALKKTHKNQFGKLFEKMVGDDKRVLRAQNQVRLKERIAKNSVLTDAYKAQRCINILIVIWRECQAYYNYFDLFKNLHELKDALRHRDALQKEPIAWVLTFNKLTHFAQNEKYYQLELESFKDANFCDHYGLLHLYFEHHKKIASKNMYDELFGDEGALKSVNKEEYMLLLDALLAHLRDNYIEQVEFNKYQKSLNFKI